MVWKVHYFDKWSVQIRMTLMDRVELHFYQGTHNLFYSFRHIYLAGLCPS